MVAGVLRCKCAICSVQEITREGFILFGGVPLFVKLLYVGQRCLEGLEAANQTVQKMKGCTPSDHEEPGTSLTLSNMNDRENKHRNHNSHSDDNVDLAAVTQMIRHGRAAICQNLNDILRALREMYISLSFPLELLTQDEDFVCLASRLAAWHDFLVG